MHITNDDNCVTSATCWAEIVSYILISDMLAREAVSDLELVNYDHQNSHNVAIGQHNED